MRPIVRAASRLVKPLAPCLLALSTAASAQEPDRSHAASMTKRLSLSTGLAFRRCACRDDRRRRSSGGAHLVSVREAVSKLESIRRATLSGE